MYIFVIGKKRLVILCFITARKEITYALKKLFLFKFVLHVIFLLFIEKYGDM